MKRKLKKKNLIIIIFIFIVIISSFFIFYKLNNKEKIINTIAKTSYYKYDELKNLGYNKKEIKLMDSKLNHKEIKIVLKYDYLNKLIDIINNQEFNANNLEQYIIMGLKFSISVDDIIYVINNNHYNESINYDNKTISIIKSEYFINDYLERYVTYSNKNSNKEINEIISNVNANLDYDYYTNTQNVDMTKGNLILVNKYYKLASNYVPKNLVTVSSKYGNTRQMDKEAYEAFIKMHDDASKQGLSILVASPYRSFSYQTTLYNNYVKSDGLKEADTYSARPGYSEHQTGLAVDVKTASNSNLNTFYKTKEYTWMCNNAHKYGFILRYPKGKENITGYMYESWHYRYLGTDIATKVYNSKLTYEEYYAYYIK